MVFEAIYSENIARVCVTGILTYDRQDLSQPVTATLETSGTLISEISYSVKLPNDRVHDLRRHWTSERITIADGPFIEVKDEVRPVVPIHEQNTTDYRFIPI